MKNYIDTIGYRTCDYPTCAASAPPRAQQLHVRHIILEGIGTGRKRGIDSKYFCSSARLDHVKIWNYLILIATDVKFEFSFSCNTLSKEFYFCHIFRRILKIVKNSFSFVMSYCLSAWNNWAPHWTDFQEIWHLRFFFLKSVKKNSTFIKIGQE